MPDDAGDASPRPHLEQHDAVIQPLGAAVQTFLGSFEDLLLGLLPVGGFLILVQLVRQLLGSVRCPRQSTSCKASDCVSYHAGLPR